MSKATELFPDIHYKMSKKIAQLTKVIYQLNSRNEDHQVDLDHQQVNHSEEIQNILRDAAARISRFKDSLDLKQKQVNDNAYIEKLVTKYEHEKQQAFKDVSQYKLMIKENESKLVSKYQDKFSSLSSQVAEMNKAFESRISSFVRMFEEFKTRCEGDMEIVKRKHADEVNQMLQASNRKYEDVLLDSKTAREAYMTSMAKKAKDLEASVREEMQLKNDANLELQYRQINEREKISLMNLRQSLEEQLIAQRLSLTAQLEDSLKNVREKSREIESLEMQRNQFQGEVEELRRVVSEQEGDIDASRKVLMSEIAAARQDILNKNAQMLEQRDENDRLTRLLAANSVKTADLESLLKSSTNELIALNGKIRNIEDESQAAISQYVLQIAKREEDLEVKSRTIAAIQQDMTTLNGLLEAERSRRLEDVKNAEARYLKIYLELQDVQESTALADQRAAMLREMAEKELELVNKRITNEALIRQEYEKEISHLGLKILDLQSSFSLKETEWVEEMKELDRNHSNQLHQHEEEIKRLENLQAKGLKDIDDLTRNLFEMEENVGSLRKCSEADVLMANQKVQILETTSASLQKELAESRSCVENLASKLHLCEECIRNQSNSFVDQLKTATGNLDMEWKQKMESIILNHQKTVHTLKSDFVMDISNLKIELSAEKEAVEVKLASEIKALSFQYSELLEEFNRERELKSKLFLDEINNKDNLRQEYEKSLKEQEKFYDDLRQKELNAMVLNLSKEFEEKERRSHSLHSAAILDLQQSFEEKIQALATEHSFQLRLAMRKEKDAANAELENQRLQSLEAAKLLERNFDSKIENLLKTVKNDHVSELNALNNELTSVRRSHSEESRLRCMKESEIETQKRFFEAERQGFLTDFSIQLTSTRESGERRLRELEKQYETETRKLAEAHLEALVLIEQQRDELLDQNARLEIRWETRESRPEDVERMRHLESEIVDMSHLLQRTKDEMLYFKREVINREESYNTKFNVSPVVGVMNVVKPKQVKKGDKPPTIPVDGQRRASLNLNPLPGITTVGALTSGDDNFTSLSKTKALR